jgi:hypothetical protein
VNWASLTANWKSTVQAILSAIIGLGAIAPSLSILSPKVAGALVAAGAVAKVILGVSQKDAGVTLASTPSGVETVPSHEIPDNPNAVPVTKENPCS